jgi:hypothetical protein
MIMSAPEGVILITIFEIRSIATSDEPITVVNIETVNIESGKKENMAKKLMDALRVKQLSAAKLRMLSFRILALVLNIPIWGSSPLTGLHTWHLESTRKTLETGLRALLSETEDP